MGIFDTYLVWKESLKVAIRLSSFRAFTKNFRKNARNARTGYAKMYKNMQKRSVNRNFT